MSKLTHIDDNNRPTMVDIGDKSVTRREATARSGIRLPPEVLAAIEGDEIQSKKGPVFATAIIAGVMAAKKTHELIPFCHPLGLEKCSIDIRIDGDTALIDATCRVTHKTGVEMEALTAASVAALTIYDMCKGLSHDMVIENTRLLAKSGGKKDVRRDA
ncbi:MAG: cyclic pyranopterin monophosphate synthase MoaC [Pseudomonadota bacterium]